MVLTPSTMKLPLGEKVPDFSLPDLNKKNVSLSDFSKKSATLVFFACNHCPYVVHVAQGIAQLAKDYSSKNVGFVAINSNDIANYPDDSPEKMKVFAKKNSWTFPYLFDETQETAQAYHAACTPDFFLLDSQHHLVYRGQLDDARPGNDSPVDGKDLRKALDCALHGKSVPSEQKPSMGCNIKWKTASISA